MFRGGGAFDELSLEGVVRIDGWRMEEEISDFRGEFRTEGADDVVESRLLRGDTASGEFGLDLGEPDFGIGGPERWYFDADIREGGGDGGGSTGSATASGGSRSGRIVYYEVEG